MKLNKKNLSIFLAVFALFTVSISPDVQAASSTQYTAADCISEQLLESTGGDKTHFPENLTAEDRAQLLDRIKADGRPILVVTDAYYGQKSGVVTVMKVLQQEVEKLTDGKVTIKYVMPDQFHPQLKLKYQNLMLSRMSDRDFEKIIKDTNPQAVHVMVEGSLGKRARSYLIKHGIPFTTAYHSMFPEFVRDTLPDAPKLLMVEAAHQMGKVAKAAATPFGDGAVAKAGALADKAEAVADRAGDAVGKVTAPVIKPLQEPVRLAVNKSLRDFHSASEGVMVPTRSMAENLVDNGYNPDQLRYWSHGVDTELFNPSKADPKVYQGLQRPISLFVGRVAAEKNLEDFLKMDIPGTKVVVGGGPDLEALKAKYPKAAFLGGRNYEDLPKYYASSDVFVFPSLTDTFGLVQLEANASGVPVVAYKVQGPVDVITSPKAGSLADYSKGEGDQNVRNLETAWHQAQGLDRAGVRQFAEDHTWEQSALEFLWFLHPLSSRAH